MSTDDDADDDETEVKTQRNPWRCQRLMRVSDVRGGGVIIVAGWAWVSAA